MNVATITMPSEQAKDKLREYRRSIHAHADKEYARIVDCYRQLAKGRAIINAEEAIVGAGVFPDSKLPKLAICAADMKSVRCIGRGSGSCFFWARPGTSTWDNRFSAHRFEVPGLPNAHKEGEAMVPLIPPGLMPEDSLSNYHILWEAEWKVAPRDPYLLKRIGGPLFAVIAEWDLTEVERAVMNVMRGGSWA